MSDIGFMTSVDIDRCYLQNVCVCNIIIVFEQCGPIDGLHKYVYCGSFSGILKFIKFKIGGVA